MGNIIYPKKFSGKKSEYVHIINCALDWGELCRKHSKEKEDMLMERKKERYVGQRENLRVRPKPSMTSNKYRKKKWFSKLCDIDFKLFITKVRGIENWRWKERVKTFRLLIHRVCEKSTYVIDFLFCFHFYKNRTIK